MRCNMHMERSIYNFENLQGIFQKFTKEPLMQVGIVSDFDQWHFLLLTELSKSDDPRLKEIAQKSLKEVTYHKRWSSEWVVRLGDGTDESKEKIQRAIDDIWYYTGEAFKPVEYEKGKPLALK